MEAGECSTHGRRASEGWAIVNQNNYVKVPRRTWRECLQQIETRAKNSKEASELLDKLERMGLWNVPRLELVVRNGR